MKKSIDYACLSGIPSAMIELPNYLGEHPGIDFNKINIIKYIREGKYDYE